MKSAVRSLALIAIIATVLAAVPAAAQEATGGLRYSITVTKFENQAGWHGQWDIGDAWGTVLTDMLNQSGKFIVLGETDMRAAALDEQDFAASGRTAGGAKAPVTGQMTPAQILVKGAITHVQGDTGGADGGIRIKGFKVTVYLVDSTTGQVLASTNVVGTHKRKGLGVGYDTGSWGAAFGGHSNDNVGLAVQDACAQAVDFLIAQLPNIQWSGAVVMIKDGKVYVNRGSREGIAVGQTFSVGEVEILRDPDTGEVLDQSMSEVARLKVSQVKDKLSICDVVDGSIGAVAKGMMIHLN